MLQKRRHAQLDFLFSHYLLMMMMRDRTMLCGMFNTLVFHKQRFLIFFFNIVSVFGNLLSTSSPEIQVFLL